MTRPSRLFSLESEQAVLGALLFDNAIFFDVAFLKTDHFYDPVHQLIFDALSRLIRSGQLASPITLHTHLSSSEGFKEAGGRHYLEKILQSVPAISSAVDYAKVVQSQYQARALYQLGAEITKAAAQTSLGHGVQQQLAEAERKVAEIAQDALGDTVKLAAQDSDHWLADAFSKEAGVVGIETGLSAIDTLMSGLQRGELTVIAARPGMGKSALVISIMRHAALNGIACHFNSIEMTRRMIWARLLSDEIRNFNVQRVEYKSLLRRGAYFDDQQRDALQSVQEVMQRLPLRVDEGKADVLQVAAGARQTFRELAKGSKGPKAKPGLIVVDYLQLMQRDPSLRSDLAVGENAAGLKALAKELEVPVVLLSQLNRQVENREDKRPTLADLRESGNIEEHADVVGFLLRPEYYSARKEFESNEDRIREMADVRGVLRLIIDKFKNGPTDELVLDVDIACNAVRDAGVLYPQAGEYGRAA
ncbi:MAG: DnaB-like helicase C-terminal domain-containing protein [Pseudomonadota bacterium]